MVTIDLWNLFNLCLADFNTQQGGMLRPARNFQAWVNAISLELHTEKRKEWELDQNIDDDFGRAFLFTVNAIIASMPGKNYDFITLPSDYGYFSSLRIFKHEQENRGCLCDAYPVLKKDGTLGNYQDPDIAALIEKNRGASGGEISTQKLDNSRWGAALAHVSKGPSIKNPLVTQIDGGIKVAPKGLGIGLLDYFKLPVVAVFAYTTNSDDTIDYDPVNSIQLNWPISVQSEFVARIKKRYASYTRQENIYQEGEQERQLTK
jgi:hypothetical protein